MQEEQTLEPLTERDLHKMKELLRHAGEFIAYFELAETKIVEWRQELEQQTQTHHMRTTQQLESISREFSLLEDILTQAGLVRFRLTLEKVVNQADEQIRTLQQTSNTFLTDARACHEDFSDLLANSLTHIEKHTQQAMTSLDKQLAHYDTEQFKRIADESYELLEKTAHDAISKSGSLLKTLQWRLVLLTLTTTLFTTLLAGLYINSEFPWETHQKAHNERSAGKFFMQLWPKLSDQEKTKLLKY